MLQCALMDQTNALTSCFQGDSARASGPPETPASAAAARRSIFAPKARDDLVKNWKYTLNQYDQICRNFATLAKF